MLHSQTHAEFARQFVDAFEHRPPAWAAVLCVVEEAGEFAGAYRRWTGHARRSGTYEAAAEELADVVIAAYTAAHMAGIDLDAAILAKRAVVLERQHQPVTA